MKDKRQLILPLVVVFLALTVFLLKFIILPVSDKMTTPSGTVNSLKIKGDWSVYRGNAELTAFAPGAISDRFSLLWTVKCGETIQSSPVVSAGKVYISTVEGDLACVKASDGSKVWSVKDKDGFEASPLLYGDKLYCGTSEGNMQAHSLVDGRVLWRFSTNDKIVGSANAFNYNDKSCVTFGSYDNNLYCLDAEKGAVLWKFKTENYINGTPAVSSGLLAFGGCDSMVRLLSLADGAEKTKVDVGSYVPGSPAFTMDHVYVAQYTGDILRINAVTGKVVWKFSAGEQEQFFGAPAVGEGVVAVSSKTGSVYGVSVVDGRRLWVFKAGGSCMPVICDGKILLADDSGTINMLLLLSGKKVWGYELGEGIAGSPAVIGNMFIVASQDGSLYAFSGEK